MDGSRTRPREIREARACGSGEAAQLQGGRKEKNRCAFVRFDTTYKNNCRKLSSAALRPIFGDVTIGT